MNLLSSLLIPSTRLRKYTNLCFYFLRIRYNNSFLLIFIQGDFTYAHQETVPSIEEIGTEVAKQLKKYKLKKVYVATDGTDEGNDQISR